MLNYQLNAHGSFTPAAVAPPNAITPEQVLRHEVQGWYGGTGTIPSVIVPVLCISYHSKWNSPEPKNQYITGVSWRRRTCNRHTKQGNDGENKNGTNKAHHTGEGMK